MNNTNHRDNNFDFLRQFAAFLVILGHSQSLVGVGQYGLWGHGIATIGVLIFFGLSGYLVTMSWMRDPSYLSFFVKRSLRIFPALALCVVLSAVVLGPLLTTLSLSEYFSNPVFDMYFSNIMLLPRYSLPGVFSDNIYPHAVNGSLWSLPVEYACYMLIALVAIGRSSINAAAVAVMTLALYGTYRWYTDIYDGPQIVIWGSDLGQSASIMPFFMVSALLCILRDKIPFRWDLAAACVVILVVLEHYVPAIPVHQVTWIFVPYIVLTIGWASTPVLRRFGRFGDPSYGMYLYAFPVQQTLVYVSDNQIGFVALTVWTTILSAILGMLSWRLLEKPALTLKNRFSAKAAAQPAKGG